VIASCNKGIKTGKSSQSGKRLNNKRRIVMNITFTAPTPFVKPWTLEDSRIIFGNDIINLADIINFSVSGKPSALTSGIITILTNDSKNFYYPLAANKRSNG